ncbi:MAG: hypothetical protein J1F67_10855 [Muribaculaceae bacterium]|nr:hypothetical protein [Muribaculaceae bacterium]
MANLSILNRKQHIIFSLQSSEGYSFDIDGKALSCISLLHVRSLVIALISVIMLVACERHTPTWKQMDVAESLMNVRPDSALAVLEGIQASDIKGKETSARYALLKSVALDKNYIDTTTFDILQPAIDYYIDHGSPDEQLRTYYYQGRIYQNQGNNDSAIQSFMRGKDFCQEASDTLIMANLMVAQATILYSTYKIDDYIKNNLEAAKLYHAINRPDYEISCLANVLDGSILNNDRTLADSVMSIAQERVKHNSELGIVIAPYALSYALKFGDKEDIVDILYHYDRMQDLSDETKLDFVEADCKIGDSYNANRFMNSIDSTSQVRTSLKYLAIKSDVLELNGDIAGALTAYRKFSTTIDSIHMNIFSRDLLFAQERHEMEKANLMEKQRVDRIIWLSLCIVFILLIITGYIYYRYRLGKAKSLLDTQEKQRLQLEKNNLIKENENLELKSRQVELECERQSLAAENLRLKIEQLENESEALKELLEERKDLSKPIEDAIKIRIEMLNGLLASRITDNNSYAEPYGTWKDQIIQDKDKFMNSTRLAFKASHPKFIEYLEQHGLTEAEINYVCLYAVGLRGKEVGEYIQLKRHYHISSDIRKKLNIDAHQTNIGIYIRKLMKQL